MADCNGELTSLRPLTTKVAAEGLLARQIQTLGHRQMGAAMDNEWTIAVRAAMNSVSYARERLTAARSRLIIKNEQVALGALEAAESELGRAQKGLNHILREPATARGGPDEPI